MATHKFHKDDPVVFEISGMPYRGALQKYKGSKDAEVLVTEQGGRETNCSTLLEMSGLRPLEDKVGIE